MEIKVYKNLNLIYLYKANSQLAQNLNRKEIKKAQLLLIH